jgi:HSP20 family protein
MAQTVKFNDPQMNALFNTDFGSLVREVLNGADPFAVAERVVGSVSSYTPKFDMRENDKQYVIVADVPGVKTEDLNIDVNNDVLTVTGSRESKESKETETIHQTERSHGNFKRTFNLSNKVDSTKIGAALSDGVLTVTLPKTAGSTPRKIPVTVK